MANKSGTFEQAVSSIMRDWRALKIAVDHSLGGELSKEKAEWLVEVTCDFIKGKECGNS